MQMGFFYLSTVGSIQKSDSALMIGDPLEARVSNKVRNLYISDASAPQRAEQFYQLNEMGFSYKGSGQIYMKNFQGFRNNDPPDAFMYCVTETRNDVYWKSIGYNSCIEISNFYDFSSRLNKEIDNQGIINRAITDKCFYEEIEGYVDDGSFKEVSYFRKTPKHAIQKEIRTIFQPWRKQILKPKNFYIEASDLIKFCN